MGAGLSGFATSVSVEIDVPAEIVWDTIIDLEAAPKILGNVRSFDRISGSTCQVGTKWRETRVYKGQQIILLKTITDITEEPLSISINVDFSENDEFDSGVKDAVNTSTLTVRPLDEVSCLLVGTLAFQTGGLLNQIFQILCRCCIVKKIKRDFRLELEDYAAAALKVQRTAKEPIATHQ